jgi:hypothetical protein
MKKNEHLLSKQNDENLGLVNMNDSQKNFHSNDNQSKASKKLLEKIFSKFLLKTKIHNKPMK